jgi:type IV secretory pathway ATPase VirB11/archaellum biosynthesis ATPase
LSCEFSLVETQGERTLKFFCEKCGGEGSIEQSKECMRNVVLSLAKFIDVEAIVLAGAYDREYRGCVLTALEEISRVYRKHKHWPYRFLTSDDCRRCEEGRKRNVDKILLKLIEEPENALNETKRVIKEVIEEEGGETKCKSCRNFFVERSLRPLLLSLESLNDHICHLKKKKFLPLLRPQFLSTRLQIEPPDGATLIDAYEVEDCEVRIYYMPQLSQCLYFLMPQEYQLSPEHVALLNKTREVLLAHEIELEVDILKARKQIEMLAEDIATSAVVEERLTVERDDVEKLAKYLARFTAGLGLIEMLLSDERVQDIYVDSPIGKTPIHIYHRDFEECLTNVFLTHDDIESLVSKFRAISGRPFSEADPVLDLNLAGVRISAIGPPLSPDGTSIAMRRHKSTPWTLPQFVKAGFITPYAAGLLSLLVDGQATILIAGSRGAGKTSLLGALMLEIPLKFRILAIEDTAELPIPKLRELGFKILSMRVHPSVAGRGVELSAEDALRAALRLGESVIVMGEVRSTEARTLYEAMRVGAAGNSVMGTIHGATSRDVYERIVYDLQIPPSSFKATDVILIAAPIRSRGGLSRVRRLTQVVELGKKWKSNPIDENGFRCMMKFDFGDMILKKSDLKNSQLIKNIAQKWGVSPANVLEQIDLRARMQEELLKVGENRPELLEAGFVTMSNVAFRECLESQLKQKSMNCDQIFDSWMVWLKENSHA